MNTYLVVVTKAVIIGQIYHRKIFQISKMEFICLSSAPTNLDLPYIEGLEKLFATKSFYFSDDYDLTNSLENFLKSGNSMKNKRFEYMFNADWID